MIANTNSDSPNHRTPKILTTEVKTCRLWVLLALSGPSYRKKKTHYEDGSIEGDMLYIRVPECKKYCSSCDFYWYTDSEVVPGAE